MSKSGEKDHGWVSAKQAWYMKEMNVLEKRQWDEFMDEEARRFQNEVALAKSESRTYNVVDGSMRGRFEGVAA